MIPTPTITQLDGDNQIESSNQIDVSVDVSNLNTNPEPPLPLKLAFVPLWGVIVPYDSNPTVAPIMFSPVYTHWVLVWNGKQDDYMLDYVASRFEYKPMAFMPCPRQDTHDMALVDAFRNTNFTQQILNNLSKELGRDVNLSALICPNMSVVSALKSYPVLTTGHLLTPFLR